MGGPFCGQHSENFDFLNLKRALRNAQQARSHVIPQELYQLVDRD